MSILFSNSIDSPSLSIDNSNKDVILNANREKKIIKEKYTKLISELESLEKSQEVKPIESTKSVYEALDALEKVGDKIDDIVDRNGIVGTLTVEEDGIRFKSFGENIKDDEDLFIKSNDIYKEFIDNYFKFKTNTQLESTEDLGLKPTEDELNLDVDLTSFSFSPEVAGFESEIKPTEEKTYDLGTDIAGQMRKSSEIARNQLKEDIESKELKPNCK